MAYYDALYGYWEPPSLIRYLAETKEVKRLKGITQGVVPMWLMPGGRFPSRFDHGMGVAYLATKVAEANPEFAKHAVLLGAAALLHDAGNSPFAHLAEHFLREITGKNGESFLENVLEGSEAADLLAEYELSIQDVIRFVTGAYKPFSQILNGSFDIDNLDNVLRYARAACLNIPIIDPLVLLSAFQFVRGEWVLQEALKDEIAKWRTARLIVYSSIYSERHQVLSTMLYRAVELAYMSNDLPPAFFHRNDKSAIEFLLEECNPATQALTHGLLCGKRYWLAYENQTDCPTNSLVHFVKERGWKGRHFLAEQICEACKLKPEDVCVYIGAGKDRRGIQLPYVSGQRLWCELDVPDPIYRVQVFINPDVKKVGRKLQDVVYHWTTL